MMQTETRNKKDNKHRNTVFCRKSFN
jgi:hypothetical protein